METICRLSVDMGQGVFFIICMGMLFGGTVPPNNSLFGGTVPPNNSLFGRTVPPNKSLFGGTVPPNNSLFGKTIPPNDFLFDRISLRWSEIICYGLVVSVLV